MFGDHDVGGLSITDSFKNNLDDVFLASGLKTMPEIQFDRVGLNADDIERLNLVWIDGLETSSGKDLSSKSHPQFKTKPVQDYLYRYGAKKCEANALLRCPEDAESILLRAIDKYIPSKKLIDHQDQQLKDRDKASQEVNRILALI